MTDNRFPLLGARALGPGGDEPTSVWIEGRFATGRRGLAAGIVLLAAVGLAGSSAPCRAAAPAAPTLPPLARDGAGVLKADLDGDGHEDLVVSNDRGYGIYLYVPPEKARAGLEWHPGWTRVMREGKPGDSDALPPLTGDAVLADGRLTVGDRSWTFEELLRVPLPPPLTPAESRATMGLAEGFEITLAAAEPAVMDPVFIDFDERGRMWVAEMGDYPFAAGETTKDGDFTWKDGLPGEGAGRGLATGRVRVLEDADGDGRFEKSTLFLDGLKHVTGLACWQGGVFVASVPEIFHATDADGDGRCDHRETWFTGFASGNSQHLVNGFCLGLDGWFHGANGDSGGRVRVARTGETIDLGRNDFAFDPRSGRFRTEAGTTQCGRWRDDFGNWFGNDNVNPGWHYWLPLEHLQRNPAVVARSLRADLTTDLRVRPAGPRQRRLNQASRVDVVTSACNAMPYRGGSFGPDDERSIFICEPANNLVLRRLLDYGGQTITAPRHPADRDGEFLAARDRWFRPVMARSGPDGALYVVDMYRAVLEHPEWIPAALARRMPIRGGETMGRIWRVARPGQPARPARIGIDSPVGWARDTAQRLALERGRLTDAAEEATARRAATSGSQKVRLQALFTLRQVGLASADELVAAGRTLWPFVRSAALVSAGSERLEPPEAALVARQAAPVREVVPPVAITAAADPDRRAVVARYAEVADRAGDPLRGREIFRRVGCAACHRLGAAGAEVGPDLGTVADKPAAQLVESIFDPSRAVEQRFKLTTLVLEDGTVASGIVAAEVPGGIVLRMAGGGERVLPRAGIDEMVTLDKSVMPEGFETVLSVQDCADLLAAIRQRHAD
jgi:putative membrane-bound dehydrogenase-like protein